MKKNLSLWQFWGFALTALFGSLLHFVYQWTNESAFAALFSAVNESTFEHMKILYVPLFLFALVQSFFFKDYKNFWCVKFIGIIVGLVLIPVIFYTYTGAFGKSPDWFNIAIFFISAAVTFILETYLLRNNAYKCNTPRLAFTAICLIGVLFVFFTFNAPMLPLFEDPLTGTYGI